MCLGITSYAYVKKNPKIAPTFRFIENVDRAWNVNPIHFNLECRYPFSFCFNDFCICVEFDSINGLFFNGLMKYIFVMNAKPRRS